jgi:V8-like Glu-specific endopeptidase
MPVRRRVVIVAGAAVVIVAVGLVVTRTARSHPHGRSTPAAAASRPTSRPATASAPSARPTNTPTASTAPYLPKYSTVGALFSGGLGSTHGCTASVIAGATRNTVITAAHCVHDDARDMVFVPAYRNGRTPEGVWHVTGAYVLPSWLLDHDPTADYAVLTVAPQVVHGRTVQLADVTGSEALGTAVAPGTTVTVVAYNSGRDDEPISCRATVYVLRKFPTFDCHGFANGSSGSPWLTLDRSGHATIHGVIGGLDQGGCHEYRSHSASFDGDVRILIRRAETHDQPDVPHRPGPPGC